MARCYIALNRNDLPDNLLQFTDVVPNTSQVKGARAVGAAQAGQTGYLTYTPENELPVAAGGGPFTAAADVKGLTAYILGNVEDMVAGAVIDIPDAGMVGVGILTRANAGLTLTITDINTIITGVCGGACDLDGNTVPGSNSTGSVEDIMEILAGAVYRIDAGTVVAGIGGAWVGGSVGDFVNSASDSDYRPYRVYHMTGSLNLSALSGQLSKLQAAAYTWLNPSYTYGTAGTALFTNGSHIPATGIGPAVTVYNNDGSLL